MGTTSSRVLQWAFIIGIIIVLNLLFGVGVAMFYESPDWDDFCGNKEPIVEALDTQEACLTAGGQWVEDGNVVPDGGRAVPVKLEMENEGYCNQYFTCQQEYEDARDAYNKTVFVILVVLGLIAILAGLALKKHSVVANGLSLGGVFSLVIASIRYWPSAPDAVRFVILLVALAVLIWFGIKKFKE